jgi:hypothetical protein
VRGRSTTARPARTPSPGVSATRASVAVRSRAAIARCACGGARSARASCERRASLRGRCARRARDARAGVHARVRDVAALLVPARLRPAADRMARGHVRAAWRALPAITVPAQSIQLGMENDPWAFVAHIVHVFRAVRRVLRPDGTLWLNMGDSYASGGRGGGGSFMEERGDASWKGASSLNGWRKAPRGLNRKDLLGMPWRVAFALQADGWILRSDIVWEKPNCMPESAEDRPTKCHEYLFCFGASDRLLLRRRRDPRVGDRRVAHAWRWRRRQDGPARSRQARSHSTERALRPRGARARDEPQQAHGLVDPDRALQGQALRDVPARARASVHPRRHIAGRLRAPRAARRASATS